MSGQRQPNRQRSVFWDTLVTAVFLGIIVVCVALLDAYNPQSFSGNIYVVDGDTIIIDENKLRLSGIDAPELDQTCQRAGKSYLCGKRSRQVLRDMIGKASVECESGGFDRYDRWLVVCSSGSLDLNAQMVALGWAVDYGGYGTEEGAAKRKKLGIWGGEFEYPQEFRRAKRGDAAPIATDLSHGAQGIAGLWRLLKMGLSNE